MSHQKKIYLIIIYALSTLLTNAQNNFSKTYLFGTNQKDHLATCIRQVLSYNDSLGFGFDLNSEKNVKLKKNALTSKGSVYFSQKLPEGNYKIDIVLGNNKCSRTTIKAESRRLMLNQVKVQKNKTSIHSFIVNVRSPVIDNNTKILVKNRDKSQLNWDHKLTLEFLGNPAIKSLKITQVTTIKTIFLAGDSTVTDQDLEPWASWGQFITNYISDKIVVANYAESGSTLSDFKTVNRLHKILSLIKPGDYLFIEFAHNDEKQKGEGIGPWQSYSNLLREYVTKSREKGGTPVLCTPTQRRAFNNDGSLKDTHGDFPEAIRKVAKELNVPLIDITLMTTKMYESWGIEESKRAFVHYPANTFPGQTKPLNDNTHFSNFGANEIAKCVVQEIKDLNLELKQFLKPEVPEYNPKTPDNYKNWSLPISSKFEIEKPDGN